MTTLTPIKPVLAPDYRAVRAPRSGKIVRYDKIRVRAAPARKAPGPGPGPGPGDFAGRLRERYPTVRRFFDAGYALAANVSFNDTVRLRSPTLHTLDLNLETGEITAA